MILILAAAIAATPPQAAASAQQQIAAPQSLLDEAAHALKVNRLEEARLMLQQAASSGQSGPRLDRLLAELAFDDGNYADAEARYTKLLKANPGDGEAAERGGIAALQLGHLNVARWFVEIAIRSPGATWRAWNAKGVVCDFDGDWAGADRAFKEALQRSPDEPEILNNEGWSHVLRGEWSHALPLLERAAALDPKSQRTANNLELAREALAENLPKRKAGESDTDFAARLNDAGVVAESQGHRARAIAAFSQALAASDSWYARAANNLSEVREQ